MQGSFNITILASITILRYANITILRCATITIIRYFSITSFGYQTLDRLYDCNYSEIGNYNNPLICVVPSSDM